MQSYAVSLTVFVLSTGMKRFDLFFAEGSRVLPQLHSGASHHSCDIVGPGAVGTHSRPNAFTAVST